MIPHRGHGRTGDTITYTERHVWLPLDFGSLPAYLGGLAVARMAHEVAPGARSAWTEDSVVLVSCSAEALLKHILERYVPSPVLAAWNQGCGLYGGPAAMRAVDTIRGSTASRLAPMRAFLALAEQIIHEWGIAEAGLRDRKAELIATLRDRCADDALPWLDAVAILDDEGGVRFPPLFGTGGNDARLDFGVRYLEMLGEVMDMATGAPTERSEQWLRAALTGTATHEVTAKPGYMAGSTDHVNPWRYLLAAEGGLSFAGSVSRRLGVGRSTGPWMVALGDERQLWGPLWSTPQPWPVVARLLADGAAVVGSREAESMLDMMRATADPIVDGYAAFSFEQRNGQARLAVRL